MSEFDEKAIKASLATFVDEHSGQDLISANMVGQVSLKDTGFEVEVTFGYPAKSKHKAFAAAITKHLEEKGHAGGSVRINTHIASHSAQKGVSLLEGVKNTIAIASGKGGVGKSTSSVNLALALQQEGAKVALLDADIYGPSQPKMLGVAEQKPEKAENGKMMPVVAHGLKTMSIGYLIDERQPMIWRGPMVTQALEQLLRATEWGEIDYMVIDLPPGTGDTQLTLAQKIPVSGSVIVTTPQDISLIDAQKALKMFDKVNIPILGVVENMSVHICPKCGHESEIFGAGAAQKLSTDFDSHIFGKLPLEASICEAVDAGTPSVAKEPNGVIANAYCNIALSIVARLAQQDKSLHDFPDITFE